MDIDHVESSFAAGCARGTSVSLLHPDRHFPHQPRAFTGGAGVVSVQASEGQRDSRHAPGADQEPRVYLGSTGEMQLSLTRAWQYFFNYFLFLFCFLTAPSVVLPLQPCFAEVEFPESTFVDQVELLLKDPVEKERYFQVIVGSPTTRDQLILT